MLKDGEKMKRITASLIVLSLFLSLFTFTFNIQRAKAVGPVYIRSDGSVDPPEAPILREGNFYALVGNIGPSDSDGIVIEKDNIVLDGQGYTVQGYAGSRFGVYLPYGSYVIIENLHITGFSHGIYALSSSNIVIQGNTVTNNLYFGIYLYDSSHANITSNIVVANPQYGILLDASSSNILSSNNMSGNLWNFGVVGWNLSTYNNHVDTSNTVDGRPVYYWINQEDATVPSNAGYVALINCTLITVSGLNLTHNHAGLLLVNTSDSIISGNNMLNNYYGLDLEHSSNNTLSNNAMFYNQLNFNVYSGGTGSEEESFSSYINHVDTSNTVNWKPIYYWIDQKDLSVPSDAGCVALVNCTDITVKNMNITQNGSGVLLAFTTNSTVEKSALYNNDNGVWLEFSSGNRIVENNMVGNSYSGVWTWRYSSNNEVVNSNLTESMLNVYFENSPNNSVYENYIAEASTAGVWIHNSSGISVHNNYFVNNFRQVRLCHGASNNLIYHNNFISPTNQVALIYSGSNSWDNGYPSGGNYWSDYNGTDQFSGVYQDQAGSDGIGDSPKPVFPNSSQIDRYPLMGLFGPSTTTGENVTVFPVSDVGLLFENVTAGGSTTANETETGPTPLPGYKIEGKYYDIQTTASYSGNITIRIIYDDANMTLQEEESLQLMRWNETTQQWMNITTQVDTENNVIYGETDHLSIFSVHSELIHDLSIFGVHLAKTVIGEGCTLRIDVDIRNEGDFDEDFDVTVNLIAGDVSKLSIFGVHMIERSTTTVTFVWNTAGFTRTTYTVEAQVSQVPYEIDTSDNTLTDGTVKVTIPGDVDGDFFVNIKDATQIGLYWMQTVPPSPATADINGDGIVNIKDATIIGVNWLQHA